MLPLILLLAGGTAATVALVVAFSDDRHDKKPDLSEAEAPMGKTRWKLVNAMLPDLKAAAERSQIPMGLLTGWICKESGGKLATHPQPGPGDTKLDERGYFQLTPEESKSLGLDHQRLSTDHVYSINAGLLAIGSQRVKEADANQLFPKGSSAYWRLVKLHHTMGSGDVNKLVAAAKAAGATGSWDAFEQFALANTHITKHSPAKWFPLVAEVYRVGLPFGFGTDGTFVVGASPAYTDIVDPLDCLLDNKIRIPL